VRLGQFPVMAVRAIPSDTPTSKTEA